MELRKIRAKKDGKVMKCYYLGDKLHREDGPEIQYITLVPNILYDEEGRMHRGEGAVEFVYDREWWIEGLKITEEEFNAMNFAKDLNIELSIKKDFEEKKLKI